VFPRRRPSPIIVMISSGSLLKVWDASTQNVPLFITPISSVDKSELERPSGAGALAS